MVHRRILRSAALGFVFVLPGGMAGAQGTDDASQAVEEITNDLSSENLKEIPSRMIGPMVMNKLKDIDQIAFVRYASVYRQFEDVGEFIDEIQSLEKHPANERLQPDLF